MKQIFILLLILLSLVASAKPLDESLYSINSPYFHTIKPDSIVEGSVKSGGLQPDYIIDYNHPAFDDIRSFAKIIKESNLSTIEKISAIRDHVSNNTLPNKSYTHQPYLKLLKQYRDKNIDIPLSEYVTNATGVCREHALIMHFALKEGGIPNEYVYSKAQQKLTIEDHAFNIVEYEGRKWIVDAYNAQFDGLSLDEAMRGIQRPRENLFTQPTRSYYRKIKKIVDYPRIWQPKEEHLSKIPPATYLNNQNGFIRSCLENIWLKLVGE